MRTPGKLEVTIKIQALPVEVTTAPTTGWKSFELDCEGQRVTVTVRPKMWTKLADATQWPLWTASITGKMGPRTADGWALLEPNIQVFERKAKPEAGAPPTTPGSVPAGG